MLKKIADLIVDHMFFIGLGFFAFASYWTVAQKNRKQKIAKKFLEKAIKTNSDEPLTLHPIVDSAKCMGCGACTRVCPEGDILQMINHKAVLVTPTKCVGHGECEAACPFDAIELVFGTKTRGMDIPRLTSHYETNIEGLYIAGELGGMGLIRNAIKQGVLAGQHAITNLNSKIKADYDLFIVGSGPAGLALSLAAIAAHAKYRTIEQNSFGGTVKNFPRQKIVMSHPADLPLVGKMIFAKNKISKEALLTYWDDIRKQTGLHISENEQFESLEKSDGRFTVKTNRGKYTARKVILAMGVRGSPRRLGLSNEDLPKVTYNLLDPAQYQGRNIAIVGGGNSALEAAEQLCKKKYGNRVTLIVEGANMDRANDENIDKVEMLQRNGFLHIWFNSQVKEIEPDSISIERAGVLAKLENDFLFLFIGAEYPHKFLMSLGIQIEKQFGKKLSGSKKPA
jgi:thioredoxin reductase/Pyruvate/2-oxoacid:ferredoxin oxidoreductase delta subunit